MLEEGPQDAASEQQAAIDADTLRLFLMFREMTQKELAERSGIHESDISRYLGGTRLISRNGWIRLLKGLQITPLTWNAAEYLVFRLRRDRQLLDRSPREALEYDDIEPGVDEVREGPPREDWTGDPDKAHEVVDGIARVFERSMHQIADLLIEARR